MSKSRQELLAIVKAEYNIQKFVVATFFWRRLEGAANSYEVMSSQNFAKAARKSTYNVINENTPCIANATYQTLLFADGNKVMKWNYLQDWFQVITLSPILQNFIIL